MIIALRIFGLITVIFALIGYVATPVGMLIFGLRDYLDSVTSMLYVGIMFLNN